LVMSSSTTTIIPVVYSKQRQSSGIPSSSEPYSVIEHGNGCRTIEYKFDLFDYEPEDILVLLDDFGTLKIRAQRSPYYEFKREYNLGANVDTKLIRNTLDSRGLLEIAIYVSPRRTGGPGDYDSSSSLISFDLNGYRPENVNVRVNNRGLLKVNAYHVDTAHGNRINREYFRQYQLPSNVNPDLVRAKMNEQQILTIELPPPTSGGYYTTTRDYYRPPFMAAPGFCFCNIL